jgi:hypothetical protein
MTVNDAAKVLGCRANTQLDRYYFPTGDEKAVFVDTVSGGIDRAQQEAAEQVAYRRRWCKKRA